MSLHSELLKQARFLAQKEPKRRTQASLRRSVSASYYALFHLLVEEATRLMLSGNARGPLRDCLSCAFHHSAMKQIAIQFANRSVSPKVAPGFNQAPLQQELIAVASSFVQLLEARHEADYNRAPRFTRREALDLADMTEQAFPDWGRVRGSLQADTFLNGLLAYKLMQG